MMLYVLYWFSNWYTKLNWWVLLAKSVANYLDLNNNIGVDYIHQTSDHNSTAQNFKTIDKKTIRDYPHK